MPWPLQQQFACHALPGAIRLGEGRAHRLHGLHMTDDGGQIIRLLRRRTGNQRGRNRGKEERRASVHSVYPWPFGRDLGKRF
jgi:hypothetical protein